MSIKIALAGNPNCGKTTMFNDLTGSSQYVGNWPGVTVEKKEGRLKGRKDVIITDLPGVYSLSPYTLEEVVSRDYLIDEKPGAVLNLVDGTNLERNLYLTTQLAELGIPTVIALNMMDLVEKSGDKIDTAKLAAVLGCEVIETSALKNRGSMKAAERAAALAVSGGKKPAYITYSEPVEQALSELGGLTAGKLPAGRERFFLVKLFERDEKILEKLRLSSADREKLERIIEAAEDALDDDSESIVTNERYEYITKLIRSCYKKKRTGLSVSDKIDRVVTNRFLALPIFVAVMFLVYYISVTTVGTIATDWANDGVFGDGWHLCGIGSSEYEEANELFTLSEAAGEAGVDIEAAAVAKLTLGAAAEAADVDLMELGEEAELEEDTVTALSAELPLLEEPDPAEFGVWVPGIPAIVEGWLEAAGTADWLSSLILDGIIGGVGAVLGFVPQMLVLFLFLALLEDCGYMARVAFIMDRIFRKFGLSGKSFIPMLISSGCGVPGIMATKTIENEKDRRMTIMTTTFIPCGAKLPIIALIFGAMAGTEQAGWVAPLFYFLGVAAVILSGIILKKTRLFAGDPAPFVMELPQYHLPAAKSVLLHMWERARSFIVKAGTVIFLACGVIWFLSNFGWAEGKSSFGLLDMDVPNAMDYSILGYIGQTIAWIFAPLGFGNWQGAVASITGLVAKENVVGTFGVLFGLADASETDPGLWTAVGTMLPATCAQLSFLAFNLLCAPCFAAIGAIRREMASGKWTAFAIAYQCLFAYAVALMINQFGLLFAGGGFTVGTVAAILVLGLLLFLLFRPARRNSLGAAAPAKA